jgi:hypothetical protein
MLLGLKHTVVEIGQEMHCRSFLLLPSSSPFLTSRYKMVQRRLPERSALATLSAKMGIILITLPHSIGTG